jgi:hypothetical protein
MQTASEFDVQGARQELLEFYQYLPSLNFDALEEGKYNDALRLIRPTWARKNHRAKLSLNGWNLNGSAFGHDNASRPLPVLKSHLY